VAGTKAIRQVLSCELGGDAAHLAGLIGDMRGVFLADIDLRLAATTTSEAVHR